MSSCVFKEILAVCTLGINFLQPVTYGTISNLEKEKENFELQNEGNKLSNYLIVSNSLFAGYLSYT